MASLPSIPVIQPTPPSTPAPDSKAEKCARDRKRVAAAAERVTTDHDEILAKLAK